MYHACSFKIVLVVVMKRLKSVDFFKMVMVLVFGNKKISNSTPWTEDVLEVKETEDRRVLKTKVKMTAMELCIPPGTALKKQRMFLLGLKTQSQMHFFIILWES